MIEFLKIKHDCSTCTFHSNNMSVDLDDKKPCCTYKLHAIIHPENKSEPIKLDKYDLTLCDNYILSIDHIPTMYYIKEQDDIRKLYKELAIFFDLKITKYSSEDIFYPAIAFINVNKIDVRASDSINEMIIIKPMMDILNYESPKFTSNN